MRWLGNHYRPTLELLEKRDLPTSTYLSGGVLYVTDTHAHDYIAISQPDSRIAVKTTPMSGGASTTSTFDASKVHAISVYAHGGNDVINLRPSTGPAVNKTTYIYAYDGNNQVFGGNGSNTITGYGGHNNLSGGGGTDYLAAQSSTDVLNGGGGFDWYYRPFNANNAFPNGEHVSDVKQGKSPSCQSDAALAEGVQQGYNFANNMRHVSGSTYQVSLYGGAVKENVTFTGWYNSYDPVPGANGEYWTILMYRARLEALGISPFTNYSTAQWNQLNANTGGRLYSVADALSAFTGRLAQFAPVWATSAAALQSRLAHGDLVVASTPQGSGVTADGIVYDHAYAVMSVYYQGGTWKVQLYNPWGFDSVGGRTIESLSGGPVKNNGFITLSWSEFANTTNFQGITLAQATSAHTAYFKTLAGSRL